MGNTFRLSLFLMVMIFLPSLSFSATFQTISGEVVIEAEDYTNKSVPGAGAIGDWTEMNSQYMQSSTDDPRTLSFMRNACRLDYEIYFNETGRYYIHLRTLAEDHTQNGFFATFDGVEIDYGGIHPETNEEAEFIYVEKIGSWFWLTDGGGASGRGLITSFDVNTPGYHTFSLYRRDKGSRVDRIWLTRRESDVQHEETLNLPNADNFIRDAVPAGTDRDPYAQSTPTVWQPYSLTFNGPQGSQYGTGQSFNPFLDIRLNVTFTNGSKTYTVPGFFDTDANGGASGNIWRVIFTPDESGEWQYSVSFRSGNDIAVTNNAGTSAGSMDGQTGSFTVSARDTNAEGFLSKGRLVHETGSYYLKSLGDDEYWVKGGSDSPENFLGCPDIVNTRANPEKPDTFHTWNSHAQDWGPQDPTWDGGRGKGIIGSLNYLASKNVNSIYLLLMNIGGDGQDVWPFSGGIYGSGGNDNTWFDCKKLRQWELIFGHAQRKGIAIQFVLNEGEFANKMELDNANLGVERRLFYREMIARFGHHNAITWNISEEYNHYLNTCFTVPEIRAFAQYIKDTDPYGHPVTVHNGPGTDYVASDWTEFMGSDEFDMTSFQFDPSTEYEGSRVSARVESLRSAASSSGRIIPIAIDEFTFTTMDDNETYQIVDMGSWSAVEMGQIYVRKNYIYPIYFSGGMTEIIFRSVLRTQDFRDYAPILEYMWNARKFMEVNLPYWQMSPADHLISGYNGHADVLAKEGEIYAIYLPRADAGTALLDLGSVSGSFTQQWYNPRTGSFQGGTTTLNGGDTRSLGAPPNTAGEDWVVFITNGDIPDDPNGETTVNPTDDAYLQGSTRYNNDKLRVDLNNDRVSFLKFNVSGIGNGTVTSATLRLRVKDDEGSGPLSIYLGDSNAWTENDLNISNAPDPLGPAVATNDATYGLNEWHAFDVLDAVSGDGMVSFIVEKETAGGDVAFGSKESIGYVPELVIEYEEPIEPPVNDNILENAGFETGTSNWTRKGTPVSISTVTAPVRSGAGALSVVGRQDWWHGTQQNILGDVQSQGKGLYRISLWVRPTVANATFNGEITLNVDGTWYQGAAIASEIKTEDWHHISGIVNIDWDGTLEDALFTVNTTGDLQDFYLDDCSVEKVIAPAETSAELLYNTGFENGTTGWGAKGSTVDISTVDNPVRSGSSALSIIGRATWWHGMYQNVFGDLSSHGQGLYKVSAWVKRGLAEDVSYLLGVSINVDGTWSQPMSVSAEIKTDDWVRIEGYIDLSWDGNLQGAQFNVNTTENTGDFFVDECSFVKVENN